MLNRNRVLLAGCLAVLGADLHAQFVAAKQYGAGLFPNRIAIGDMTSDGAPDLVVGSLGTPQGIRILENDGHGAFSEFVFLYPGVLSPSDIALADLDGNGFLDIVMADPGISVLDGTGTAVFGPLEPNPLGWGASAIAVVDATGDGDEDVIAIGPNDAAIFVGNGDGSFQQPWLPILINGGPAGIAVADANNDGVLDFATLLPNAHEVALLIGSGGGAFAPLVAFPVGTDPSGLTFGDTNADGQQDLVVSNFASHDVHVLFGDGAGDFDAGLTLAATNSPTAPILANFEGNAAPDIAVVNQFASFVSVFAGSGNGQFGSQQLSATGGTQAWDMGSADFDDSGTPDLAVVNASSNTVSVLLAAPTTCSAVAQATQTVRPGVPPNPPALLPDPAHGPVVGLTWKLVISHDAFGAGAFIDGLILGIAPLNAPTASGTLLVDITKAYVMLTAPVGQAFDVEVPQLCLLVGVPIFAQGVSITPFHKHLTNAIDAVIGTD